MGRFRTLVKFFGRPNRLANLGHQRNAAGYINKSVTYAGGKSRQGAYSYNSFSTGGIVEDDYEVDYTWAAAGEVASYMFGQCANAGQEALIQRAIEEMELKLIVWRDFDPTHTAMPDEAPIAYIQISTNHAEAVGQIIEGGIEVFYAFAESVNQ
jgi:hypothetical protein